MLGEITTLYLFLCITVDVVGNTFGNGEGEAGMICIWVNDGVNEDVKIGVDVVWIDGCIVVCVCDIVWVVNGTIRGSVVIMWYGLCVDTWWGSVDVCTWDGVDVDV